MSNAQEPSGNRKRIADRWCDSSDESEDEFISDPDPSDEQYIPIDHGTITATRQKAERRQEEEQTKPTYFPMQETLADMVVKRIEDILWIYCKKELTSFKKFDFQIYTARLNMLEKQTYYRVMDPYAECFPKHKYLSPDILRAEAGARIQKYSMSLRERGRLEELKQKAQDQPDTLFLIVADEAHWGRCKSDEAIGQKADTGANNQLVNCWTDEYSNVFLLLVTATGFNLKVKESRLNTDQLVAWTKPQPVPQVSLNAGHGNQGESTRPGISVTSYAERRNLHLVTKQPHGHHYLYTNTDQIVTDGIDKVYLLHHLRWAEGHQDTFLKGMMIKLSIANKVNLSMNETKKWLGISEVANDKGIFPLIVTNNANNTVELLMQGKHRHHVTIKDSSEEYQLVCLKHKFEVSVGFMKIDTMSQHGTAAEVLDKFKVHLNMGEDVLCLQSADIERGYLLRNTQTDCIILGKAPANQTTNDDLPGYSLEYTFLVEYIRSRDDLKPGPQYLSLNFYYNTMRNMSHKQQLIRCDLHRSSTSSKLQRKAEPKSPSSDDYLAAEYAYYILLVDKMRKSELTCRSLRELLMNPAGALGDYMATRKQLLQELIVKLDEADGDNTTTCTSRAFQAVVEKIRTERSEILSGLLNERDIDLKTVFPALLDCLLHMSDTDIEEFAWIDPKFCKQWTSTDFAAIQRQFQVTKQQCLEQSETFKIIDRVVTDVPENGINGQMVVVRVSSSAKTPFSGTDDAYVSPGNRFYNTLCYARQVASKKKFTFEVIRDFDNFKVSDVMKDEVDTPKYRMHSRLQPKTCEFRNPHTFQRCNKGHGGGPCIDYDAIHPPLKCRTCGHIHRGVEDDDEDFKTQPNLCEFRDVESNTGCQIGVDGKACNKYEPVQYSLTCTKCGHLHKEIKDYNDCNNLPCILIMVKKGRLGDTFPESFFAMDLRLSFGNKYLPKLSTLMQELGRLCRYAEKPTGINNRDDGYNELPYALISSNLHRFLTEGLKTYAVFYGIFAERGLIDTYALATKQKTKKPKNFCTVPAVQIDGPLVSKQILDAVNEEVPEKGNVYTAARRNADHGNEEKHHNRLLLEAEPQIGKTGVYLKTISILRKKICPDYFDDSDESENDPLSDDEMASEPTQISEIVGSCNERDICEDHEEVWRYPYWRRMDIMKYPTFTDVKYGTTAGSKTQQSGKSNNHPVNKNSERNEELCSPSRFRTYSYSDPVHAGCTMCFGAASNRVMQIDIGDFEVKLSVPMVLSYIDLLEVVRGSDAIAQNSDFHKLKKPSIQYGGQLRPTPRNLTLKCWIFTPTYKRSNTATINYRHTMVHGPDLETCSYVHILVVRQEDFDAYHTIWGSTHAILQLPQQMPNCMTDVQQGGLGYARLFVQRFAEHYDLPQVFLLDDDITCAREVTTRRRGSSNMLVHDGCSLTTQEIPLFKLLKHLEDQFYRSTAPVSVQFEECPFGCDDFEKYTGPSSWYAALGCLKESSHVIGHCVVPHKKTNVYSLVLLNIRDLKEKGIKYNPLSTRDDVELYQECDDKGLWVCRYNRFVIRKLKPKPEIAASMFCWNDAVKIPHGRIHLQETIGSVENLYRFIRHEYPPCCTEEYPQVQSELYQKFSRIRNGSFNLLIYRGQGLRDLYRYYKRTEGIGGFVSHLLLFDTTFCWAEDLKQRGSFKSHVVEEIFKDVEKFEVYTSHNIYKYNVEHILLVVQGKIKSHLNNTSTSNTINRQAQYSAMEATDNAFMIVSKSSCMRKASDGSNTSLHTASTMPEHIDSASDTPLDAVNASGRSVFINATHTFKSGQQTSLIHGGNDTGGKGYSMMGQEPSSLQPASLTREHSRMEQCPSRLQDLRSVKKENAVDSNSVVRAPVQGIPVYKPTLSGAILELGEHINSLEKTIVDESRQTRERLSELTSTMQQHGLQIQELLEHQGTPATRPGDDSGDRAQIQALQLQIKERTRELKNARRARDRARSQNATLKIKQKNSQANTRAPPGPAGVQIPKMVCTKTEPEPQKPPSQGSKKTLATPAGQRSSQTAAKARARPSYHSNTSPPHTTISYNTTRSPARVSYSTIPSPATVSYSKTPSPATVTGMTNVPSGSTGAQIPKVVCTKRKPETQKLPSQGSKKLKKTLVTAASQRSCAQTVAESCAEPTSPQSIGNVNTVPSPAVRPVKKPVQHDVCSLVFFELELASRDRDSDIKQVAALHKKVTFHQFCLPDKQIAPKSSANVERPQQTTQATDQRCALVLFMTFLETLVNPILVSHNCTDFGVKVLMNALKRYDLLSYFEIVCVGFADTLPMFKSILPKQDSYKQESLVANLLRQEYDAGNAVDVCASLQSLVQHVCHDDKTEIIKHSFRSSFVSESSIYDANKKEHVHSLLPLVNSKIMTKTCANSLAGSGLSIDHILSAYTRGGVNGVESLFLEKDTNNLPRVANAGKVARRILPYLMSKL